MEKVITKTGKKSSPHREKVIMEKIIRGDDFFPLATAYNIVPARIEAA